MNRRVKEIDAHIGARLRHYRIENGLTQEGLAQKLGITYQQVHKYENGVNRIASGRLLDCWRILGVEPNEFFDGINDQPLQPPPDERATLLFLQSFAGLSPAHQKAVAAFVRALSSTDEAA